MMCLQLLLSFAAIRIRHVFQAFALSELVGRKWGGMLGKSSKESLYVPSGRDILGG